MDKSCKFKLEALMAYIDENFYNPSLDVEYVSHKFGISISYMSRSFKKKSGMAMADYIARCRIERTKYYLLYSSYSLAEIAERVGYSSANVLIRSFKRFEKITPNNYRLNTEMKK